LSCTVKEYKTPAQGPSVKVFVGETLARRKSSSFHESHGCENISIYWLWLSCSSDSSILVIYKVCLHHPSPNKCVILRILLITSWPSIPVILKLFNHEFFFPAESMRRRHAFGWINALIKWFSEAADIWTYRAGFLSTHLVSLRIWSCPSVSPFFGLLALPCWSWPVGNMLLMRCVDRYSYTQLDWTNSSTSFTPPLRPTMTSSQPLDLSSNASSKSRYRRPMNWGIQPHNWEMNIPWDHGSYKSPDFMYDGMTLNKLS